MTTPEREKKYHDAIESRQEGIIVFEDISDKHNAEAAFRCCEIFGFQKVYLIFEKAKAFDPRKVGYFSSSSAHKWLSFTTFDSTMTCLEQLKKDGYQVLATVCNESAENVHATGIEKAKIAIVFGNEKLGVSDEVKKYADRCLTILERGMIQSLNLSVATGVILYEITRQRQAIGMSRYKLSLTERQALLKDFTTR